MYLPLRQKKIRPYHDKFRGVLVYGVSDAIKVYPYKIIRDKV